jgi:hypothetical protein
VSGVQQHQPWWRDASSRNRVALVFFAAMALLSMLFVAFTNYLFAGDQRVMVVTMVQDAGQDKRDGLREACGSLPGITPVADRGNPDPRIQGRFPVRFDIADTTTQQEAALIACLNENGERFGVVGYLPEKDGN